MWLALGLGCLADFAAVSVIVAALAPTWRLALVVSAGYAAPALPFSGFSIPYDSMGKAAQLFARFLPTTWLIQGQALVWSLGSGFSQLYAVFGWMLVLFVLPLCLGLPLLSRRIGRILAKERQEAPRHA